MTQSDAQPLVDTLSDKLAEVGAEKLGGTLSDAHALVETLADTVAEVARNQNVTHGAMLRHWTTLWLTG